MTVHFEPFVHLAGLTHDDALIAWGGFWFTENAAGGPDWQIVEDPDLDEVADDERRASIGFESRPFGTATVEVRDPATHEVVATASTDERNHVWVRG